MTEENRQDETVPDKAYLRVILVLVNRVYKEEALLDSGFQIVSMCYDSKTLGLINEQNLVLGLTQENLIENSVQNYLPYIPQTTGLCTTILAYHK